MSLDIRPVDNIPGLKKLLWVLASITIPEDIFARCDTYTNDGTTVQIKSLFGTFLVPVLIIRDNFSSR